MSGHHAPRVTLLVAVATVCACATPTDGGAARQAVRLQFVALPAAANVPLSGPYVSVIDSLNLVVTSLGTGERQEYGKHLARRDSIASFPVTVEQGDVQFAARLVSNNGSLLFAATQSARVSSETFAPITVDLAPSGPVLLVAPDTTSTFVDNGVFRFTVLTVYNRGRDSLTWQIKDTMPVSSTSQCPPGGCIRFVPKSGVVQAGAFVTFQVFKQQRSDTSFTRPITFVVMSSTGEVPVVVRPF